MKMHADQIEISASTVANLVASQFPEWADLPVRAIASNGTVNALFRLGDQYVLRFPLCPDPALRAQLEAERDHIARIGPYSTVEVPTPLAMGEPGAAYPGPWSVHRWIPGDSADADDVSDSDELADDLASFVRAIRGINTGGQRWGGAGRGGPLAELDADVRLALTASRDLVDVDLVARAWALCRDVPRGSTPDVWIHADLMPGNLIVRDGRLTAVIDFGAVGIGDPAVDLLPAWTLLTTHPRSRFRRALQVDDAQWLRGRGWAIVQAAMALPYYVDTNPMMASIARRTLDAVIAGS